MSAEMGLEVEQAVGEQGTVSNLENRMKDVAVTEGEGEKDQTSELDAYYLELEAAFRNSILCGDNVNLQEIDKLTLLVEKFLRLKLEPDDTSFRAEMEKKVELLWQTKKMLSLVLFILNQAHINQDLCRRGMWFMEVLVEHSNKSRQDSLANVGSNVFGFFIHCLRHPYKVISDQATSLLATVAHSSELLPCIVPFVPQIFQRLKHQCRENPESDMSFYRNIAQIVTGFLVPPKHIQERIYQAIDRVSNNGEHLLSEAEEKEAIKAYLKGHPEWEKCVPTVSTLAHCAYMLGHLLDVNDEEIVSAMAYCVLSCLRILGNSFYFIHSGLAAKLVSVFARWNDVDLLRCTTVSISYLLRNEDNVLPFLRAACLSDWLAHFWKVLPITDSGYKNFSRNHVIQAVNRILHVISTAIISKQADDKLKQSFCSAGVLQVTLPSCLRPHAPYSVRRKAAVLTWQILDLLPPTPRNMYIHSTSIKVSWLVDIIMEQTKDAMPAANAATACILEDLMKSCTSRRDEALCLGIVPALLNLLSTEKENLISVKGEVSMATLNIVFQGIYNLMELKPKPPLRDFKDIPGVVQSVWQSFIDGNRGIQLRDVHGKYIVLLKCLGFVASYGMEGIELILKEKDLLPMIQSYLRVKNEMLQGLGLLAIFNICKGTQVHRLKVLDAQVLELFDSLLKHSDVATRKMTLECLYAFLTEGILTTKQKVYVYNKLFPLIKAEFQSDNPETRLISDFVIKEVSKLFRHCPVLA